MNQLVSDVTPIHAYIKRVDGRLDRIENLLKDIYHGAKVNNLYPMFKEEFNKLFPMETIENIKLVDAKIVEDENFKSQMVSIMIEFFFLYKNLFIFIPLL